MMPRVLLPVLLLALLPSPGTASPCLDAPSLPRIQDVPPVLFAEPTTDPGAVLTAAARTVLAEAYALPSALVPPDTPYTDAVHMGEWATEVGDAAPAGSSFGELALEARQGWYSTNAIADWASLRNPPRVPLFTTVGYAATDQGLVDGLGLAIDVEVHRNESEALVALAAFQDAAIGPRPQALVHLSSLSPTRVAFDLTRVSLPDYDPACFEFFLCGFPARETIHSVIPDSFLGTMPTASKMIRALDIGAVDVRAMLARMAANGTDPYTVTCDYLSGSEDPWKPWVAGTEPLIVNVQPNVGPPAGGTPVTITGQRFGPDTATINIEIDGEPCAESIRISEQRIVCVTPPGVGVDLSVVVVVSGVQSDPLPGWTYFPAVLYALDQTTGFPGSPIRVFGDFFLDTRFLRCQFGDEVSTPALFVSSTELTCIVPTRSFTAPDRDAVFLQVTNDGIRWARGVTLLQNPIWSTGAMPLDWDLSDSPASIKVALAYYGSTVDGVIREAGAAYQLSYQLAVDTINLDPILLPRTRIEPILIDTKGDNDAALAATEQVLLDHPDVVAFVGSSNSGVSVPLALRLEEAGVPLIGYRATTPELSSTERYPLYARVVLSDTLQGQDLARLAEDFGWKRLAYIYTNDFYGRGISAAFRETAEAQGIEILATASVELDGAGAVAAVSAIVESGARIIYLMSDEGAARAVLQAAVAANLFVSGYGWVLSDGGKTTELFAPEYFGGDVQAAGEFRDAIEGIVAVGPAAEGSGQTFEDYQAGLDQLFEDYPGTIVLDPYTPFVYDAMLAVANGVDALIREQGDISDGQVLMDRIRAVRFDGASGLVELGPDHNDRRELAFAVGNFRNGEIVPVGSVEGLRFDLASDIIWPGKTGRVPSDTPSQPPAQIPIGLAISFTDGDGNPLALSEQIRMGFHAAITYFNEDISPSRILPLGTQLVGHTCDLERDAARATVCMDELAGEHGVVAVVGARFSALSLPLAEANTYQIPQISPASSSTQLGDPDRYPYFARMTLSDGIWKASLAGLIYALGWRRVVVVASNDDYGLQGVAVFNNASIELGVAIADTVLIDFDQPVAPQLDRVVESNARVIMVQAIPADARALLEAAVPRNLTSSGYVWLGGAAWVSQESFATVPGQVSDMLGLDSDPFGGLAGRQLESEWRANHDLAPDDVIDWRATYTYDAVEVLARVADGMINSQEDFRNGPLFMNRLRQFELDGVSGRVSFGTTTNDRTSTPPMRMVQLLNDELLPIGSLGYSVFRFTEDNGCPPGTRVVGPDCIQCQAGTASPGFRETECSPCAVGSRASSGTYAPLPGFGECIACPAGTASNGTACPCQEGYYLPADGEDGSCQPCPPGALCDDGGLEPLVGYWQSETREDVFYPCPEPSVDRCPGGGGPACGDQYQGVVCGVCESDYASGGFAGGGLGKSPCNRCPAEGVSWFLFLLTIVVLHMMLAFVVWTSAQLKPKKVPMIMLKILLNYAQMLRLLADLGVSWPESIVQMNAWHFGATAPTMDGITIDCTITGGSYVGQFFLYIALSIWILLLPTAVFGVTFLAKGREWYKYLKDRYMATIITALFLLHPTLTLGVSRMLLCEGPYDGKSYLRADRSVECYTSEHYAYLAIAAVFLVVYGFGIPLFGLMLLRRNRNKMDDPHVRVRYGFLFLAYRPSRPFFEIRIVGRKLALILISVLMVGEPPQQQLGMAMMVLLLSILAQIQLQPFPGAKSNRMELFALSSLMLTSWSGIFFQSGVSPTTRIFFEVIVGLVNLGVFVIGAFFIARYFRIAGVKRAHDAFTAGWSRVSLWVERKTTVSRAMARGSTRSSRNAGIEIEMHSSEGSLAELKPNPSMLSDASGDKEPAIDFTGEP